MINAISGTKKLVNNGWTIQNRRLLERCIGSEEVNRLHTAFLRVKNNGNVIPSMNGHYEKIVIKTDDTILKNNSGHLELKLNMFVEGCKKRIKDAVLRDKDISLEKIVSLIKKLEYFAKNPTAAKIPQAKYVSETMRLLYTEKYHSRKRLNKEGYPITTIIDKKTGAPVEAYIKCEKKNKKEEKWEMYIKDKNEPTGERLLGYRSFYLDGRRKKITPGYMDSDGNKEFAGIGLRMHQLTVERMMQKGFNNIEIEALPDAFPFHYKLGFRIYPDEEQISKKGLQEYARTWGNILKVSPKEIKKCMVIKNKPQNIFSHNETEENLRLLVAAKKINIEYEHLPVCAMTLDKEWLDTWKKLAESQPILLGLKHFKGFNNY